MPEKSIKIEERDFHEVDKLGAETNLSFKDQIGACVEAWKFVPDAKRQSIVESRHRQARRRRRHAISAV